MCVCVLRGGGDKVSKTLLNELLLTGKTLINRPFYRLAEARYSVLVGRGPWNESSLQCSGG